jgi:TonB family protein
MWRELLISVIGHVLVLSGMVLPSLFHETPKPSYTIYTVRAVTPSSIAHLLERTGPVGKPKPNITQVKVKPDATLPQKKRKKRQAAKQQPSAVKPEAGASSESGEHPSGLPGIGLDSKFDYPDYLIEMVDLIKKNWQPPITKGPLSARIHFILGRDGKIVKAVIEQTTGNLAFDDAAMSAIIHSSPFPQLPEGYKEQELGVHFDFIYD